MNQRMIPAAGLSIRSAAGGSDTFYGEPVIYDSWSELLYGQFYERMRPGCFADSLASGRDVICTVNHDPGLILGRQSAGTLRLIPTQRGLSCEVSAPDTSYARDLAVSLGRGDVRGMSFMFDDVDVEWGQRNGKTSRDVVKAKLYEVSFVTMPAYLDTTAGERAAVNAGTWLTLEQMKEMEYAILD